MEAAAWEGALVEAGGRSVPVVASQPVSTSVAGGRPGIAGGTHVTDFVKSNWSASESGPGMVAVVEAGGKVKAAAMVASEVGMEVGVRAVAGLGVNGRLVEVGAG